MVRDYATGITKDLYVQSGQRIDERRAREFAHDIMAGMVSGLGWRVSADRIDAAGWRADASWFSPDALTAREAGVIRPAYVQNVLSEAIPTRTVEAWAESLETAPAISHAGSVAVYRSGMTNVPYVTGEATYRRIPIHDIVTATRTDWKVAFQSNRSPFSIAEENATAVRVAMAQFIESALVHGVTGLDFIGLNQLGANRYRSSLDYSSGATTMDQIWADLIAIPEAIRVAAGYRGVGPNTVLIGPRWAAKIRAKANFSAGGNNETDLLTALRRSSSGLAQALDAGSIDEIMVAPSLVGLGGEADRDGMLLFDRNNSMALRQIVAMAPSPVRTASTLTADETLWNARHAGLDLANGLSIGIATAKVA